ncbi:Alpha/beta hydrolase family [Carpediemonas membranifera]|uniref:Alpha/beta hydrolase family n=1 Tax=Carpediemonas membranifera TaxID=201153 RepID=A0A8J6DZU4_9EUKA|nr:Alpha/beta hydrolase family [Carpediemonas membranifera]|eukprot:KAG9391223.1 Alpha/beta hydrolase family [Carpediemonas membranifera]
MTQPEFTNEDGNKIELHRMDPENGEVRGTALIIHGLGEYAERYSHIAKYFAEKCGLACWYCSLEGYGLSDGKAGLVRSFEEVYYRDLLAIFRMVEAAFPDVPRFVIGHSMGGLISLDFAQHHPEAIANGGVYCSGPCLALHPSQLMPGLNLILAVCNKLAPTLTVNKVKGPLCSEPANLHPDTDPVQLRYNVPARTAYNLSRKCTSFRQQWIGGQVEFPFFVTVGDGDIMVDPTAVEQFYTVSKSSNKKFELVPGRMHELWQEANWEETVAKGAEWVSAILDGAQ